MGAQEKLTSRDIALSGGTHPPTEKIQAFIDAYLDNGGDVKKAWVDGGMSASTISRAKATLRKHWKTVEEGIMLRIGSHVPFALDGIVELAKTAKSETVRLNALKDIMSRAGYDGAIRIESKVQQVEDMDEKDIEAELIELLKKTAPSFEIVQQEPH